MQSKISELVDLIKSSDNIIFFGGAGVSTESGIPDFRSKDGLYNQKDIQFEKYSPEYLLSKDCLQEEPEVFYEFYKQKLDTRDIQPNITHKVLAKLEEMGKLKAVITQNIDGLHQKAGSKVVCEIHGTTQRVYCSKCKCEYPADFLFNTKIKIPTCECGGFIRPDVTLYNETLPEEAWDAATSAIKDADLLIVGGTSLKVYPANTLLSYFFGRRVVVINKGYIDPAYIADDDLYIKESLGMVFSEVCEALKLEV